MRSGGDALSAPVHCTHSVDVDFAAGDVGEQLRRIEPPERFLRNEQRLPDPLFSLYLESRAVS
jgi:hypothetical protein